MNTPRKLELLRFVARQAATTAPGLSEGARADLFEGMAYLLAGEEREKAMHTAFLIRESERSQLQFLEILNPKQ